MKYTIPLTNFPTGICNPRRFSLELAYAIPAKVVGSVTVHEGSVTVNSVDDFDLGEVGAMNYMASIHTGEKVPTASVISASRLKEEAFIIDNDTEWQVIAGTIARPLFFHPIADEIIAQVVGELSTMGTGAEMKVLEQRDDSPDVDMMLVPQALPDTNGVWKRYSYTTQIPPRSGLNNYQVMARLNGAGSMAIRYTSMTMLKVV